MSLVMDQVLPRISVAYDPSPSRHRLPLSVSVVEMLVVQKEAAGPALQDTDLSVLLVTVAACA